MSKYRNIVICGDVGTGTSTLSKGLAKKLGWRRVSGGEFFRKWSRENGIPLWNKLAIPDAIDKKFDREMFDKMQNESNIVFDTHYGGWFSKDLPDVLRIMLTCDKNVTTKRVLDRKSLHKESPEEIEKRRVQLREKFKKLYSNDNYENPSLYHLIIDTTHNSIKETLQEAYREFSK